MKSSTLRFRSYLILFFFSAVAATSVAQNNDFLLKMQDPNVDFWALQKEFNDFWQNRTDYKGKGYKVFRRWEYINELRVLDNGKLLGADYVLNEYNRYMAEAPALKSASGTWNIVGPTNYPTNLTGQPTGKGRVNTIAFHPTDLNVVYLGSPSGGIWKSENGGTNWNNLSSNIPYLGVSAILIHPTTPDIIYIGTGDRDGNDALGVGVFKSVDGGVTWAAANAGMGNVTVGVMLMHPSDPEIILAATKSGIYKTVNGGQSWSLVQGGDFRDIRFKPDNPNVVYAARIASPAQFWRSTNNGDTWTQVATPTAGVGSRMVIGVSPANANYVYLVQIKDTDNTFKAMLRSTDAGLTFTERSNSPNLLGYNCDGGDAASQATYDLCIEVDQANAETVYVGGINSWKSSNGGTSWSPVTHWVGNFFAPGDPTANCGASVHADHHWLQWSPHHSPARLYLGHDGGISYTANGGATWTEISNDLPTGQIYKVGQSATLTNSILGGFQDNGVSGTNNGSSFSTVGGGDGMECAFDYTNPNFCYRESQNGNLRRSTTGIFGSYSNIVSTLTDQAAFVAPYMLHRSNPNTMFFGRADLWRSNNVKASPSSSVTWENLTNFAPGLTIRVVEQSPANENIVYISRGTGSGSTQYRSDNAMAAAASVVWNTITKPGGVTPSDIKAHPTDENIVYATAGMKIYKSTNKGVNWTDISGNLPALFINCLVIDKDANEGIYIGNQTGVWYKDATMEQWALFSAGLPPVDVRELEIYYDANPDNSRITAATYGRGIWRSDLIQVNVINPTDLAALPTSTTAISLSWALNASSNDVLVAVSPTTIFGVPVEGTAYMAGDALPGGGTVVYVGNATSFSHTGLMPNTNYCYKIWSVNATNQYSAGLVPVCASTLSHNWTGNVNTDWFNPGNWGPGTVPTTNDGAYMPAGRPNYPLINAAGATCKDLVIESGASLSMHNSTAYTLQVSGDWTNNGTFNRGVGTVEFNGSNDLQTIRGTAVTAFNILRVDKGFQNKILEAKSVITLHAATNPLDLFAGTFKLSSNSTITPFTNGTGASFDSYMGLWNNGGTINSGNFSWSINTGLLRVSAGTLNIGNSTGNSLSYLNNGQLIVEGGTLNIAGRFSPNSGTSVGTYIQTGGTVNVNLVGSANTTRAAFELNSGVPFTMSGGTIAIRRASSNATADIIILSTSHDVTGGTIQIGDASTPASQTIRLNSSAPIFNLTVNATNNPLARLITNALTVKNDVTISGGTLDANNLNITVGGHWSNSGTFTAGTGTVTFNGSANQNIGGSNQTSFNNLTLNNAAGFTLSSMVNATVNGTLNFSSGVVTTGSNTLIVASTGTVSRTSGHVFGNLRKNIPSGSNVNRVFEVGDANASAYTPVSLTFASVSTPGNVTAKSVQGDHPDIASADLDPNNSVNRYWSLSNSGTIFSNYDAVFQFLASDLDMSADYQELLCGKFDNPTWTYPSVGAKTATSTQITGVAAFSDFQLAQSPCAAPTVPSISATINPVCPNQPTTLNIATGNLNGAANWAWYTSSCGGMAAGSGTSIVVSPSTTTTYYARAEGGCVVTPGACGSVVVTVADNMPPSVTCPANQNVNANASCQGTVGSWSPATLSDNCSASPAVAQSPAASTVISGHNTAQTVTLTATDDNGNSASCTFTVTLKDVTGPSVACPANQNVNANASCQGTVGSWSPASLSDNCSASPAVTQSPAASTVISGHNTAQTVTLTATDDNGNSASCTFTVTLKDVTGPSITCPGIQVLSLGANCTATVPNFSSITNATDNCGAPNLSQSPAAGATVNAPGLIIATMTATDAAGNSASCTFQLRVSDVTPPSITCPANQTLTLGASCSVALPNYTTLATTSDNCTSVTVTQNPVPGTIISTPGTLVVTLTATDAGGNGATCSFSVNVQDFTAPTAKCKDATVSLGANGAVLVPASTVDNGSADNCTFSLTLTPNVFNCTHIGVNTVTLRATDQAGNSSTCTARLTIRDTSPPVAKCKNATVLLNAVGQGTLTLADVDNGSTDGCGIASRTISQTSFNCGDLSGPQWPVTLTVTDNYGNTSTCLSNVTVKDQIAPNAVCSDVTVTLGPSGFAVVYGATLASASVDNCSVWSYSPSAKVYTSANIGVNQLTITVKDWSGNSATCVSQVTVQNNGQQDYTGGNGDNKWGGTPSDWSLLVFPNPAVDRTVVAFQLSEESPFLIRLFDMNGRLILAREGLGVWGENEIPLELGNIPDGIYLLDFQTEGWRAQRKVMVSGR